MQKILETVKLMIFVFLILSRMPKRQRGNDLFARTKKL